MRVFWFHQNCPDITLDPTTLNLFALEKVRINKNGTFLIIPFIKLGEEVKTNYVSN